MVSSPSQSASPPLSRLESLPRELLCMIDDEAENPWLGYTCPILYIVLEKPDNERAKNRRERYYRQAFNQFVPIQIYGEYLSAAWRPQFITFGKIAELPWFAKEVFGDRSDAQKFFLKSWAKRDFAAYCCFMQPRWTQNLGSFVFGMLKGHSDSLFGSVVNPMVFQRRHLARSTLNKGIARALHHGCVPALKVLSRLHYLPVKSKETLPTPPIRSERWIKPWTTLPKMPAGQQLPPIPLSCQYDLTPVVNAVKTVLKNSGSAGSTDIYKSYIKAFWYKNMPVSEFHRDMDLQLYNVKRLMRILEAPNWDRHFGPSTTIQEWAFCQQKEQKQC